MSNSDHQNSEMNSAGAAAPEIAIQRLYVKDVSAETPNSPYIFKEQWKPELKLELQTSSLQLEPTIFESVLTITATVTSQEKVAFIIEIKKAGIFTLKNFQAPQLNFALECVCPAIIFPYAREVVSDLSVRAGFPPLILAPVNFEALYAQKQQRQAAQSPTAASAPNDGSIMAE